MVYLLHVLIQLLLRDLLLLREPARLLEELEPAGRDGGDDLQGAQPSAEGVGLPPSLLIFLPTDLATVASLLNSSHPFLDSIFRFLFNLLLNSLTHPESGGHCGKSGELDTFEFGYARPHKSCDFGKVI